MDIIVLLSVVMLIIQHGKKENLELKVKKNIMHIIILYQMYQKSFLILDIESQLKDYLFIIH